MKVNTLLPSVEKPFSRITPNRNWVMNQKLERGFHMIRVL